MQFFNDEDFSWRILAVESVVIMLSVLLGFTLNSWRQSASEQETVDAALESIAAEAWQNNQELEERQPYYRTLRDTLRHLASKRGADASIAMNDIPGFTTVDLPQTRTSSFETLRSTGALSNMDFELANSIARSYGLHEQYQRALDGPLNAFLMGRLDTVGEYLRYYQMRANMGKRLPNAYDQLLNDLEASGVEVEQRSLTDSTRTAR